MLKYEGFATGDTIKAFDFAPRGAGVPERYIEGTITEITESHGTKVYRVSVTKDATWPDNPRDEVFVPMETSLDYDGRVTKIS